MSAWPQNKPISPSTLKDASHDQLFRILEENPNNPYYANLVRDELSQRFLGRIGDLTEKQIEATREVTDAVNKLDSSSDRLEALTAKLNKLTWVLIFLTALAVVVPVGIEVCKRPVKTAFKG